MAKMTKKFTLVDPESGDEFSVKKLKIDENTRFIMKINVEGMPAIDVPKYVKLIKESIGEFFGPANHILFIPCRKPSDFMLYEVKHET